MGGDVHPKPADIVVYTDDARLIPWIIVETKRPTRKDGVSQLQSYMNASGSPIGYWTNGADERFLLKRGSNDYRTAIWRLPAFGESETDLDQSLTRSDLVPVSDLYAVFQDLEQEILAHQSVDTFDELFKVVFAKLYDERTNLPTASSVPHFRILSLDDDSSVSVTVRELFEHAKRKWKDIYDPDARILLNDHNIAYCVQALQGYHLVGSGDVLGTAFELLVNQEMKGDMGQYFTPRQVVSMMVRMMRPNINEVVCDPAVGSGGFLIYAMREVFQYIEKTWDSADDRAEQRKDYAQEMVIGIDNDQRLTKVAKAYMIMENDGRSGIFPADSLDFGAWSLPLRERIAGRRLAPSEADPNRLSSSLLPDDGVHLVLTNPPFAGAIKAQSTLRQYELAMTPKGRLKPSVVRAILFLERCIEILKPGGRMAIVLPQGLLNNVTDEYVRQFVLRSCRVLGVVGLHPFTFKPFTLAKTSVLFLQKWEGPPLEEYDVFSAVSARPGKTNLGRPQYLADGRTLDCDMDEIANAFLEWARAQRLSFAE